MSETTQEKIERPLSPHLQVYKPQMTSTLSIFHRAAGAALSFGAFMVVWMLVAAVSGPAEYEVFTSFIGSTVGQVLVVAWSVAFFYHFSNGIRHLFWDTGNLFKIKNAYRAGYIVLLSTIIFSALFWYTVMPGWLQGALS